MENDYCDWKKMVVYYQKIEVRYKGDGTVWEQIIERN